MYRDVVQNEYGYYTLANIPTVEELNVYYSDKYYQTAGSGKNSYDKKYTEEELKFFNAKLLQKKLLIEEFLDNSKSKRKFIDIGCGEGFAVKFFSNCGYDAIGLDYSIYGVEHINPEIKDKILSGDVVELIQEMLNKGEKFDVINMDNVLEHVLDPKHLLELCRNLLAEKGVLIIKVPNDFSYLQKYLVEKKIISKPHWVCSPDHISYFNKEGLVSLCHAIGFENKKILGNYMTEFSILNPNSNYLENPEVGKSCHFARVAQENIFNDISPEKTIELYSVLGEMGLGREIIGVFQIK